MQLTNITNRPKASPVNRDGENDAISVQIVAIQEDVSEIRRDLEGIPHEENTGVFKRLTTLEGKLEHLEAARSEELIHKRVESAYRKAFLAGLTCLGLLSALIIGILARVLTLLSGA